MKKKLSFAFFVYIPFVQAGEIERIVQSAYQKSWEIQNANSVRENAIDDYRNRKLSFLPALNVKTYNGFQGGQTDTGNDRLSEYSIEAKATLFSMAQLDDLSISKASDEVQSLKLQEKKNNFCQSISDLYLNYLLEKKKNSNLSQILEILDRQFDITSSEYRQGLKPRKDYLRLRAELRGTELEQLAQSISLKSAEDKLRDKVGADFERFAFNPASLEVPEETFVEESSIKNSALEKSLEKELEYQSNIRSKNKHDLWPKLTLGANYKVFDKNYWYRSDYDPKGKEYWSVTLGIEYNIWDWGIERRNKEVAIRATRIRENEIQQDIRNAQNDMGLAKQRIRVARRVYSARSLLLGDERESFGIISRDYREGRINFLDYVSSLRSFGRAELSVFEGLVELNKSYFQILLHKGELDRYFNVR